MVDFEAKIEDCIYHIYRPRQYRTLCLTAPTHLKMPATDKIIITTAQILEAYEAHGIDFIEIDFESTRKFKNFAQYISINFRLADDRLVAIRWWKLNNDGIAISSRIRKPEQRKYESIRMGVSLEDENGVVNDNCKAMKLLCESFEEKMQKFKATNVVTDDARAPRKQADGTFRPFHLISTKVVTPIQTTAKSKESDDIVDLTNPFFWISIPKKKYFSNGETAPPSIHYEDKYYSDETGQPDVERPVMTHVYQPEFYDVANSYHNSRTGKKIYNLLGARDEETGITKLDNTNIQDYLTRGSALIGSIKIEVAVSGRQCKLDLSLHNSIYVKKADMSEGGGGDQDDDAVDAFAAKYASIGASAKQGSDDLEDYGDYDDE